jgi:hypothetical protein
MDVNMDVNMNVNMDMDMDMDVDADMSDAYTDNSSIFPSPTNWFNQAPSTPPSAFSQTPSTPQSSGSSFSQTFGSTPCPANNAFAPLPNFSDEMEGVVFTLPRATAPSNQAAPARAPPKNGVLSFTMQPAKQQPSQAATAPHALPTNGVMPFTMTSTAQPQTLSQPAAQQKQAQPSQPAGPQPGPSQPLQPTQAPQPSPAQAAQPQAQAPLPVTKEVIWETNDPATVFTAPVWPWPVTVSPLWAKIRTWAEITEVERSLEAVVGMMPSLHVSQPDTWAWTEPTIFGPFIGKKKSKGLESRPATAANTLQPAGNGGGSAHDVKPKQATKEAAIASPKAAVPHTLSDPPATAANASSSVVPATVAQEQPAHKVTSEQSSAGQQTPTTARTAPQAAMATGTPTNHGSSGEASAAEGSRSTDKGKGVAAPEKIDLKNVKFMLNNAQQLMGRLQEINNPFASSAAYTAPTTVQVFGHQHSLSVAPTATGAASQEKPYEVGGDEDSDVDADFDFGKHFSRTAPAAVASAPSAPGAPASSAPAQPHAEASPAAASPPAAAPPPVAHPQAHQHVAYDKAYALEMMERMFSHTLPTLASELKFPTEKMVTKDHPTFTKAHQEDEAKYLLDQMLENELNEMSFEDVQEAYKTRDTLCHDRLYDLFDDWFTGTMSQLLPGLFYDLDEDDLFDLGDALKDAVMDYMSDHPPSQARD